MALAGPYWHLLEPPRHWDHSKVQGVLSDFQRAQVPLQDLKICWVVFVGGGSKTDTLPKFNSELSPEKLPKPNRKGSSSKHHFSGAMLNFGGAQSVRRSYLEIRGSKHTVLSTRLMALQSGQQKTTGITSSVNIPLWWNEEKLPNLIWWPHKSLLIYWGFMYNSHWCIWFATLPKFNSSPLKSDRNPIGKDRSSSNHHGFQG